MSKTTHKRDRDAMHHEWIVYADPMPHQIPGNPEATPECSAHSGSCNTYRQHRDLAGEWMVAAVELGDDPFSYYYTNGVP